MGTNFPDVVVLIPGFIGSVLSKDGIPIWGTSPGAIWRITAGNAMDALELKGDDAEADDLGDGIQATGVVANIELVPGLWKQGGYSILSRDLVSGLNLEPGKNFFEFAYDWRRDNRVSARKLTREAHTWLKKWRESSGHADAKLIIVAHSMGGLVARYFIECLEGWKVTKMLQSIGTPYRGSGNALNFLNGGFEWKTGPIRLFDGTKALRSFTATYQLLPIYPFVQIQNQAFARVAEVEVPNVDLTRAKAALAFHDEIRDAQLRNAQLADYRNSGPAVRAVVGTEQPTFQSAELDQNGRLSMLTRYGEKDYGGDGTVPRVSAIPAELQDNIASYFPNTHSALQSDDGAIAHMRGVLTGAQIDLTPFRAGRAPASISSMVGDAFDSAAPVEIAAKISEYVQTLNAYVTRIDMPEPPKALILRPAGDVYRSAISLPAGIYRVKIEGKNARPVEDIFLVADA